LNLDRYGGAELAGAVPIVSSTPLNCDSAGAAS
jgi:hypothetical protein